MHEIIMDLVVMLSPVLSFTMEEVWQFMKKPANAPQSVQIMPPWPAVKEEYINEELKLNGITSLKSVVKSLKFWNWLVVIRKIGPSSMLS